MTMLMLNSTLISIKRRKGEEYNGKKVAALIFGNA
jgi:hypothetical protein